MTKQVLGHISGYPVTTVFGSRHEASQARVHRSTQGGMCGTPYAESIVLNHGYVDDEDYGSYVIYTGEGGNDPNTKRQIADQELTSRNAALARSGDEDLPVRVLRGSAGEPAFSPASGYRYDGLYKVTSHWHEKGRDGFRVYRYRLDAIEDESSWTGVPLPDGESDELSDVPTGTKQPPTGNENPKPKSSTSSVVERNPAITQWVKDLYGGRCQICRNTVRTPLGPLSNGSHIQALGKPHNGPDVVGNVLCLCPSCHGAFDAGALWITDDLKITHFEDGSVGDLVVEPQHSISLECVRQHRERFA